ncbi:MAG TPA: sulfotransferase domain-containing protein, partial [Tepidisphaeraceae bacterium]|nr:sulfotransferase domain-containing protein [Tepidisphaeraceae bacterium]
QRAEPATDAPAVFHITHWKAGSQWIYRILKACDPDRVVAPEVFEAKMAWGAQAGKIYPTVYLNRYDFLRLRKPGNWRHFVVIRDLRDTLVSAYFSMKISHPLITQELPRLRTALNSMSEEEGMLYLMDEWLLPSARIQQSWLEADEPFIRYEDLLDHDAEILETVLLDRCGLAISRGRLREVIEESRFERITGGRRRGNEDITAHERKGIWGDWKNHFTSRMKRVFKVRFGSLLIAAGYEQDLNW